MAEQLVNEFTVNRPIDEAWPVICDVERIAPCLPGAQLQEIEGESYRGIVKVKLGAVTTQFKGEAHFVERDDVNHRAVLKAEGRDTGGRGNAAADIVAEATALSPTSTRCVVTTDLHITGKVAQFGRGILGDVSKKLMAQFAANLNTMLDNTMAGDTAEAEAAPAEAEAATSTSEPTEAATTEAAATETAGAETATSETGSAPTPPTAVRKIEGPATEPVDLAGMAGPALAKRIGPVLLALLLAWLLLRRRRD
jgi:carbon monoxide dehydrogenase subunit G